MEISAIRGEPLIVYVCVGFKQENGVILLKFAGLLVSVFYLGVSAVYMRVFINEDSRLRKPANYFAAIAVVIHIIYLIYLGISLGRHPVTTLFEASTTMAAVLALIFFVVGLFSESRSMGIFLFFFVFLLQTFAALFMDYGLSNDPSIGGWFLPAHIYSALIGYAAFAAGFLYNIMYLMLERELKASRFGKLFRLFPALEELDQMSLNSIMFGVASLLVSILLSFVWFYINYNQELPFMNAKVMLTLFAWAIYLIVIVFRYMFGWGGGRIAKLSICAFIIVMASFTLVSTIFRSVHVPY